MGATYLFGIFRKSFLGECKNEIVTVNLKPQELFIAFIMSAIVLIVGLYPQLILGVIEQASYSWLGLVARS